MKHRDLLSFVKVVQTGSFSKSAEELDISQPTVSSHLRALEDELGVQLVYRSTKHTKPTPEGKILYDYAIRILDLIDEAIHALRHENNDYLGEIQIAVSSVPARHFLPKWLKQLKDIQPRLSYTISACDSREAAMAVYEHHADLAIIGTEISHPGLNLTPIAKDELIVIAPATEPYVSHVGAVTSEQLTTWPFIQREDGSGTRTEARRFFREQGIEPDHLNTVANVNGTTMAINSVESGLGYTIASRYAVLDALDRGMIVDLEVESQALLRSLWLVTPKQGGDSPALRAFRKVITENSDQM